MRKAFDNLVVALGPDIKPEVQIWLNELEAAIPKTTSMRINTVYKFNAGKGRIARAVVTKENSKTWVLYETQDSGKPGCRWMISKSWCKEENIWRDVAQSYELPEGVKIK